MHAADEIGVQSRRKPCRPISPVAVISKEDMSWRVPRTKRRQRARRVFRRRGSDGEFYASICANISELGAEFSASHGNHRAGARVDQLPRRGEDAAIQRRKPPTSRADDSKNIKYRRFNPP
jgi:hypothetical protein